MISNIVGAILIAAGLFWAAKPEALKNRLKRKMNRRLKLIVYVFIIMFGLLIVASAVKARGLLPKVAGIIGMFITIKVILFITSKTSEKISDWLADKPLKFFRIWGLVILGMGVMLVLS